MCMKSQLCDIEIILSEILRIAAGTGVIFCPFDLRRKRNSRERGTGFGHRFSTAVILSTVKALVGRNANDLWFMNQNIFCHVWLLSRTDGWGLHMVDLEPRFAGRLGTGSSLHP